MSSGLYDFHGLLLGSALYWCEQHIVRENVAFPIQMIVGKELYSKNDAILKPKLTRVFTNMPRLRHSTHCILIEFFINLQLIQHTSDL